MASITGEECAPTAEAFLFHERSTNYGSFHPRDLESTILRDDIIVMG